MEQKLSALQKYYQWSKERFPIPGIVLYAGSLFYVSYYFGYLFNNSSIAPFGSFCSSVPGFVIIFLVVLHIRIFDEHKDYSKDLLAYPERLLSKGVITLKDLRILLYTGVAVEAGLSLYLGTAQFVLWIIIMVWSLLMFFEFFIPEFLNRHMGLYLLTHQIILPMVLLFGLSFHYNLAAADPADLITIIIFLFGTMCGTITYEIARKTWSSDRENENADSYTKVWGIRRTVITSQVIAAAAAVSFIYLYQVFALNIVYSIIAAVLYLFFLSTDIMFMNDPVNKKSKLVEAGGTLFILGILVNSIVAFVVC